MYKEQDFNLPEMEGLSQKQIDVHLKLYAGYVTNMNKLNDTLSELKQDPEKNAIAISELTRRIPFEWNGMRMHEYYFEALGGDGKESGEVVKLIEEQFGSYDTFLSSFKKVGMLRSIGWVILGYDQKTGKLTITWVNDHELGQLAGVSILIAMDVWEHAFLIDYLPSERGNYIDAFFANLNWQKINERLVSKQ